MPDSFPLFKLTNITKLKKKLSVSNWQKHVNNHLFPNITNTAPLRFLKIVQSSVPQETIIDMTKDNTPYIILMDELKKQTYIVSVEIPSTADIGKAEQIKV